jgi:hypothetical protein
MRKIKRKDNGGSYPAPTRGMAVADGAGTSKHRKEEVTSGLIRQRQFDK